ncbi:MAG: hypothetical protein H0Z33_02395 [Bacillaceae bacterium]|nr:hypothetical protein [Bacillaceae bacterium]
MALLYAGLFLLTLTLLIVIKSVLFPLLIWRFLPVNDFASTLYEVLIMSTGAVTVLVLIGMGYAGKHYFFLKPGQHVVTNLLIFLPFFVPSLNPVYERSYDYSALFTRYLAECGDLLGEPVRLLFFVQKGTGLISLCLGFLLVLTGRLVTIDRDVEYRPISYEKRMTEG